MAPMASLPAPGSMYRSRPSRSWARITVASVTGCSGAVPTQENPSAEVCVAQLAGSTPTSDLVLQVQMGLTFCLLTNKDEATRQSIPQRVGIVEVRDVGFDKSVTVTVSTYRVPS